MLEIVLISVLIAVEIVLAICLIILYKKHIDLYLETGKLFIYEYVTNEKFRETVDDIDKLTIISEEYDNMRVNITRIGFEEEKKGEKASE